MKIGAQLSTSHTALRSLPAARIAAILDTALATLDIVAAGTREAGEVFALVCEFGRERGYSSYLWYNLLSDVVGSEPSELVVDFEGRPSSGWGTWTAATMPPMRRFASSVQTIRRRGQGRSGRSRSS